MGKRVSKRQTYASFLRYKNASWKEGDWDIWKLSNRSVFKMFSSGNTYREYWGKRQKQEKRR